MACRCYCNQLPSPPSINKIVHSDIGLLLTDESSRVAIRIALAKLLLIVRMSVAVDVDVVATFYDVRNL